MSTTTLAAQLYTVRDFCRTPGDIANTLKKVKALGYDAVQLSALGPIDAGELQKMLEGEGLIACASHTGFERMRDEPDAVIEEHRMWGCDYVAVGAMPGEYAQAGSDGFRRFADEASEVARRLDEGGLTFGYHNHSFEFERFGEQIGMEILLEHCDPETITFEIDTYWIQHGGGDPADWIRRVQGRIKAVHLKDMSILGREQIMAEVGEGNLNWSAVLDACQDSGVKWHIVEQDTCQRDPFESLGISLRNLKVMGLK